MVTALTAARVRGDVDVLSRAGLPLQEFLDEATASLGRAVPWVAACVGTHDPTTRLLTGSHKFGDLHGVNEQDLLFGQIEYASDEDTSYRHLFGGEVDAVGMSLRHRGEVERSERMSRLMVPHFGYADEARLAFRDGRRAWGGLAIFRGGDDPSFAEAEVDFLASLSTAFARGVRGGVLARLSAAGHAGGAGPAVLVVAADDRVVQASPGAMACLDALRAGGAAVGDPMAIVASLVATARRSASGDGSAQPRARVRLEGRWMVLHASPLSGLGDRAGEVVVTIEEARPPEIVALVVAAFDLTPRERDVTQLVLQGVDTKEIAATLHLSTYTVQDHLKSVFDKADVRSRRELIARIYFDQYVPRLNTELDPSGWFASV
ncbi:helix-turn-helix transcriptional regulator [Nocardioides marinquilinus]|uniref:helix-turn-helix transcriptional regulator n=1 Tax=Nocardioides marinquilinus TaxID=1210400 RepID=UPI0031E867F2